MITNISFEWNQPFSWTKKIWKKTFKFSKNKSKSSINSLIPTKLLRNISRTSPPSRLSSRAFIYFFLSLSPFIVASTQEFFLHVSLLHYSKATYIHIEISIHQWLDLFCVRDLLLSLSLVFFSMLTGSSFCQCCMSWNHKHTIIKQISVNSIYPIFAIEITETIKDVSIYVIDQWE